MNSTNSHWEDKCYLDINFGTNGTSYTYSDSLVPRRPDLFNARGGKEKIGTPGNEAIF
jgi:hypothetical protein